MNAGTTRVAGFAGDASILSCFFPRSDGVAWCSNAPAFAVHVRYVRAERVLFVPSDWCFSRPALGVHAVHDVL